MHVKARLDDLPTPTLPPRETKRPYLRTTPIAVNSPRTLCNFPVVHPVLFRDIQSCRAGRCGLVDDIVCFEEDFLAGKAVVALVEFFRELSGNHELALVETELRAEARVGTHVGTYSTHVLETTQEMPTVGTHNIRQSYTRTPRYAHLTVKKHLPSPFQRPSNEPALATHSLVSCKQGKIDSVISSLRLICL